MKLFRVENIAYDNYDDFTTYQLHIFTKFRFPILRPPQNIEKIHPKKKKFFVCLLRCFHGLDFFIFLS